MNYFEENNVSRNLKEKDVFSVRGIGKFVLNGVLGFSKKGRLKISVIYFR